MNRGVCDSLYGPVTMVTNYPSNASFAVEDRPIV